MLVFVLSKSMTPKEKALNDAIELQKRFKQLELNLAYRLMFGVIGSIKRLLI